MLTFLFSHSHELLIKTSQQLVLVSLSTLAAILIGVPLGIAVLHQRQLRSVVFSLVNMMQTIPSLALLALLLPLLGIGIKPTLVALTLYALLPIVRSSYTGLSNISPAITEASYGLGLTAWQRLTWIQLPLALPIIISGIRTAVVINVGVATLAAFIGAGGLGDFINRGLAMNDHRLLLLGAVPAAIMALSLDWLLGQLEKLCLPSRAKRQRQRRSRLIVVTATSFCLFTVVAGSLLAPLWHRSKSVVHIGSKNFTESYILSELMAQMLESHTRLSVDLKLNLGSTDICQRAMLKGEIDIYPEYTGTAYLSVLGLKYQSTLNAQQLYQRVKIDYQQRFNLSWLPPFGFNNTQAITVREQFAHAHHLTTITQLALLAPQLRFGAMSEFMQRPDGMLGLMHSYDLTFKVTKEMDQGLLYQAIAHDKLDVINAFSTDGRLLAFHLTPLVDDQHLFPPYDAAPIVRQTIINQHPEILSALKPLAGLLDDNTMIKLNYQVDVLKHSPKQVAHDFLQQQHLL